MVDRDRDIDEAKATHPPPRVRVLIGAATSLGPGKMDLLEAIAETGSISAAARRMGMSYRRAWTLVNSLKGLSLCIR